MVLARTITAVSSNQTYTITMENLSRSPAMSVQPFAVISTMAGFWLAIW